MMNRAVAVLVCGAMALAVGCSDEDDKSSDRSSSAAEIEIEGSWSSDFGGSEIIDSDVWTSFDDVDIVQYDNGKNFAVTQNPDDADFDPGKFNKIVWTEVSNGSFYYCTVDFGLDSAEDAAESEQTADDSNPEEDGCGGFSWTKLTSDEASAGK